MSNCIAETNLRLAPGRSKVLGWATDNLEFVLEPLGEYHSIIGVLRTSKIDVILDSMADALTLSILNSGISAMIDQKELLLERTPVMDDVRGSQYRRVAVRHAPFKIKPMADQILHLGIVPVGDRRLKNGILRSCANVGVDVYAGFNHRLEIWKREDSDNIAGSRLT